MGGKLNKRNLVNFLEGNYRWLLNELKGLPEHVQEQIEYRSSVCDCKDECKHCGCPLPKRWFSTEACGNGSPDLMVDKNKWLEWKKENISQ